MFRKEVDFLGRIISPEGYKLDPESITEFMVINHPQRQSKLPELQPFYLDNIRIKQVHKTKYLGLTFNDKLSWSEQYKSVKGKVAGDLCISQETGKHLTTISVA